MSEQQPTTNTDYPGVNISELRRKLHELKIEWWKYLGFGALETTLLTSTLHLLTKPDVPTQIIEGLIAFVTLITIGLSGIGTKLNYEERKKIQDQLAQLQSAVKRRRE